ncbi:MAG: outer membrane beta-barrel protein [Bdellovibrionia bacterium]
MKLTILASLLMAAVFISQPAHAELSSSINNNTNRGYLLAQVDPDEAYDPFADYSEFDEDSDEEADINFFKNGRFLTAALFFGYRSFTQGMATNYQSGPAYGLQLSYFFDLRLALALSFVTGDHSVNIKTSGPTYTGNVSYSSLGFNLKYYLNTQNVTKGLADLNPYIIAGLTHHTRTYTFSEVDGFDRAAALGFDGGLGIEIPLLRRKAYFGIQGVYHYVAFPDENKEFIEGTNKVDTPINGDFINIMALIGMNF